MARSDLIVALVRAGSSGDKQAVRATAEAIIAEERAKQHTVLAEKLTRAIQTNGTSISWQSDGRARGHDYIYEVMPRRQLDELVLPEICRRAVDQLIEEQIRADVLRSNGLEPRHRILLVGPPGTGKTSLAEALAEAIGVSLFVVRYEAMIGSYLGETAARLKRIFDYARTAPCVLFFDEFDAIAKERGDIYETGEIKRVVASLLMQVDDLPSYTVIAAATNHPELLDRATWRRFQVRLSLPMPGQEAVAAYITNFAKRFDESFGLSPRAIARRLGPTSYAEVEEFCLNIQRRSVLSFGTIALKDIINDQLDIWNSKMHVVALKEEKQVDARSSTTDVTRGNVRRSS